MSARMSWGAAILSGLGLGLGMAGAALAQDVHVDVGHDLTADGATRFVHIQNALDHAPEPGPNGRLFIHIRPGIYDERIYVSQWRPRTTLLGAGETPADVVITGKQTAATTGSTFFSETAEILADAFQADKLTFENSAGRAGQALAISVSADRAIFKHCRFLGFQDTVFANYGRQYYVGSYISGAVDFIFGNAAAVFDRSEIHVVGAGYLTAQSRTSDRQKTGFVFVHSRVTEGDLGGKTFALGRPWRDHARVAFIDTELSPSVVPGGWNDWGKDPVHVDFAEAGNSGPGANPKARVSWSHQLDADAARAFMPAAFLAGDDHWNPEAEAARLP
jgi:pectinesterase